MRSKKLEADLQDNNTSAAPSSSAVTTLPLAAGLPASSRSVPGGNFSFDDDKARHKFSGTAVLSYKPIDELLTYASYSRGYKAGGFNLDRSALTRRVIKPRGATVAGAVTGAASGSDLQFDPEINDAYELGAKYNGRGIDVNVALFHQEFKDFQLNTFNGINFVVENINSCSATERD